MYRNGSINYLINFWNILNVIVTGSSAVAIVLSIGAFLLLKQIIKFIICSFNYILFNLYCFIFFCNQMTTTTMIIMIATKTSPTAMALILYPRNYFSLTFSS